MNSQMKFLPVSRMEIDPQEKSDFDLIIVSGDAYVDHPAFGAAVIGRVLESAGFTVAIISQPDWREAEPFRVLGPPRLAWLVTGGSIDSMVAHYTANGKPRSSDSCSPGGKMGLRPDRAVITYTSRIKQAWKGIPVILGGLEASLRRLAHYDFWSDRIRKSILLDAKADLVIYGMAEKAVVEICTRLASGQTIAEIEDVRGTVFRRKLGRSETDRPVYPEVQLPDWSRVSGRDAKSNTATAQGRQDYALSIRERILHENPMQPERLVERYPDCEVIQNPPALPLDQSEMDRIYELPFTRRAHPSYEKEGEIPALKEVSFSITSSRGCFGGCTFCAITSHQGRIIQARSEKSLLKEAQHLTKDPLFKGYIHDVGGPTANFRTPACARQLTLGPCRDRECLFPEPCPALKEDHTGYLDLLEHMEKLPGIKRVFIRSGIRYDYLLETAPPAVQERFIRQLCEHHVSGQLKVAPEHASQQVLDIMGKPSVSLFDRFSLLFSRENKRRGKQQYIIPYFISGHPGAGLKEAVELACYLKSNRFIPDQVQDFYPTPGTVASCIYYTGLDPRPGKGFAPVHVPRGREKHLQRALIHFHKPENRQLVREALIAAGREDLIGNGPEALIPGGMQRPKHLRRGPGKAGKRQS